MVFNQKEYDALTAKLAEMRKDDKYKELAQQKKESRVRLRDETDNVISVLRKKGFADNEIIYICGRVRNVLLKEDEAEE